MQKYIRQTYLGEGGIKTAGEIIKTTLEIWDIGKNLGKERCCFCGEKETTEHILECIKVWEVIKRKVKKEWLEGDKGVELVQVTEYIKSYKEIREKQ